MRNGSEKKRSLLFPENRAIGQNGKALIKMHAGVFPRAQHRAGPARLVRIAQPPWGSGFGKRSPWVG